MERALNSPRVSTLMLALPHSSSPKLVLSLTSTTASKPETSSMDMALSVDVRATSAADGKVEELTFVALVQEGENTSR